MIALDELFERVCGYANDPEMDLLRMRLMLARKRNELSRAATLPLWWSEFEALIQAIRLTAINANWCQVCHARPSEIGIRHDLIAEVLRANSPPHADHPTRLCLPCFQDVIDQRRKVRKVA
jgi:hypothetical protein